MRTEITLTNNIIYWGDFRWGETIPDKSTFRLIRRTKKNIFRLYQGLGINTSLLHLLKRLKIKYIVGELTGRPFRVEVDDWIEKGIKSQFTRGNVDPQTILRLTDIFPEDSNISQLSLFGRA